MNWPDIRRPLVKGWEPVGRLEAADVPGISTNTHVWRHEKASLSVVSSVGDAGDGVTWYVSVARLLRERLPNDEEVGMVRREFGMIEAREENVLSRMTSRSLWMKVTA